jgi:hypothetical protein
VDEDRDPRAGVGDGGRQACGLEREVGAAAAQGHAQRQRAVAGDERVADVGVERREREAPARRLRQGRPRVARRAGDGRPGAARQRRERRAHAAVERFRDAVVDDAGGSAPGPDGGEGPPRDRHVQVAHHGSRARQRASRELADRPHLGAPHAQKPYRRRGRQGGVLARRAHRRP